MRAEGSVTGPSNLHFNLLLDFNISTPPGLLTPAFAESLLVAVPPCQFTGANASIHITHPNGTAVVSSNIRHFTAPPCRSRRYVLSVGDSNDGFTVTRLDAYQVTGLIPGQTYSISYSIPNKDHSVSSSNTITMQTLQRELMARSGGMVVITVLLSIAMFLLLVGLIAVLVIAGRK
uniref:Uroplakin 2 n=1 Tax=Sphenodon punctatus TaxID=8508 RepID=A0A8D0GI13_SPHPU